MIETPLERGQFNNLHRLTNNIKDEPPERPNVLRGTAWYCVVLRGEFELVCIKSVVRYPIIYII